MTDQKQIISNLVQVATIHNATIDHHRELFSQLTQLLKQQSDIISSLSERLARLEGLEYHDPDDWSHLWSGRN